MKKIKRDVSLTTKVRNNMNRIQDEFYSHDTNSAVIELTMDRTDLKKVIVLFHFQRSNRFLEVIGNVTGNVVEVPFDTSLITVDETVTGYVYIEKVVQSADVCKFSFGVRVSEIDKHKDLPVIEKDSKRIVTITEIVTKAELQEALSNIHVEGGRYDDSGLRVEISQISSKIEALEKKTDKDTIYNDEPLKQRISALESKTDNDTVYNDTEIKQRLELLEHKPSVNTSELVTKQELESKGYLTQHQSLEGYAKKSEIPQAYNDTEVKQRLSVVEQKGEGYATKEQLASIPKTPQKLILSGTTLTLSDGGGSITLPTTGGTSGQVNEYEIHGTGMPNGKVIAPVGTTYVDTAVTNGALKWIKRTGNHNQGWEVLTGDTGWRNLNIVSKLGGSYLRVRRKNDTVTYQFGGLSWGWFGIVRRGGPGYQLQPSDRERNVFILGLGGVPVGFRSESSLIGGIYNDKGIPYGTWYIGGAGDGNMLRFQFTDPVPTDRDIGDIRVSSISYLTSEPWPERLP